MHFHLISYPVAPRDLTRPPKLHQRRDLGAGFELGPALTALGFQQGEQIFQPHYEGREAPPPGKLHHVDLSFVLAQDVLVHLTRPHYSDKASGPKRQIRPAYTDLEKRLFEIWKQRFLPICARSHVQVHSDLHSLFQPGREYCREMKFRQKGWGAPYYEVNAHDGAGFRSFEEGRKTTVFLLRLEHAWPGGPGYLCAFGMDGCTTLVWAYRLARDLRAWLEKPGFLIAELTLGELPKHVTDLRFCQKWSIEPVLHYEFAREPALV
jgi:hypothetical protein